MQVFNQGPVFVRSAIALLITSIPVFGQSAKSLGTIHETVEIDNERVLVLRLKLLPGETFPVHHNPDCLLVALADTHTLFQMATGRSDEQTLRAGGISWIPSGDWGMQNLDKSPYEALAIEPKGSAPRASEQRTASPDPTHESVEYENSRMVVLRVHIPPFDESGFHPHPDRIVIPLTEQRSRATTAGGQVDERYRHPGQVFWGAANIHKTKNLRDVTLETIIVDLKNPE